MNNLSLFEEQKSVDRKMKTVLALDQSSSTTGVCRVTISRDNRAIYQIETFKLKNSGDDVLTEWSDWLTTEIVKGYDLVVIERPVFLRPNNMILYFIAGCIRMICRQRNQPIIAVDTNTLKKYAMGTNRNGKPIDTAQEETGLSKLTGDEADAYWLGRIGFHIANNLPGENPDRCAIITELSKSPEQRKKDKANDKLVAAQKLLDGKAAKEAREIIKAQRMAARAAKSIQKAA